MSLYTSTCLVYDQPLISDDGSFEEVNGKVRAHFHWSHAGKAFSCLEPEADDADARLVSELSADDALWILLEKFDVAEHAVTAIWPILTPEQREKAVS